MPERDGNNTAFQKEDLGEQQRATALLYTGCIIGRFRLKKKEKKMRSEESAQANPLWEDGQRRVETDGKDMRGLDWRSHYSEM